MHQVTLQGHVGKNSRGCLERWYTCTYFQSNMRKDPRGGEGIHRRCLPVWDIQYSLQPTTSEPNVRLPLSNPPKFNQSTARNDLDPDLKTTHQHLHEPPVLLNPRVVLLPHAEH